jgi:hypothetical protein
LILTKRILELSGIKLNESFNNYQYILPENRQQALFDFYLATVYYRMDTKIKDEVIDFTVEEVLSDLFEQVKQDLLPVVEEAIYSEMVYIIFNLDLEDAYKIFEKNKMGDFFFKYIDSIVGDSSIKEETAYDTMKKYSDYVEKMNNYVEQLNKSNKSLPSKKRIQAVKDTGYSSEKVISFMKKLFTYNTTAGRTFGGEAWVQICDGWFDLKNSSGNKGKNGKIAAIDHIYDLQHNSGSVLDKSEKFEVDGSHDWIESSLDFKKHNTNIWKLWDKCSPGFKSFMAKVMKYSTGTSYERDKDKTLAW